MALPASPAEIPDAARKVVEQVRAIVAETDEDRRKELPLDKPPRTVSSQRGTDQQTLNLWLESIRLYLRGVRFREGTVGYQDLREQLDLVELLLSES